MIIMAGVGTSVKRRSRRGRRPRAIFLVVKKIFYLLVKNDEEKNKVGTECHCFFTFDYEII